MVALFLVAGEICVGLFKTFFQLGEGSTFVQLMCICAVLNGRQVRGTGEISFSLVLERMKLDRVAWVHAIAVLLKKIMDLVM